MTRMLLTPGRGGDVRSRASINRSSSSSSIPNMCNYYNNNINISRINNNNPRMFDHNQLPQHHYLQNRQHHLSNSTSNIISFLRDTPERGAPVSRSHSFGGMSVASNGWVTSTPTVLGDTMRRNPRAYTKAHLGLRSSRKSPKIPKVPNPSRTVMVFESVKRGIGEFIQATHEDLAQLMRSENGTSTAQKIKSAERYLKRLECHLAKIDELHDYYLLNQQLREGARNMAKAFSTTSSHSRKDSIASIKYGYKECSQTMCAIEAQLENLLGTLNCQLKGIAGFARVVPGDVYEVVIKHGDQKWKTKGRIEKDSTQHWDSPDHTFKCLVGEMLSIKASEVRTFSSVLLGQKYCEIWSPSTHGATSLFSASPQFMTVSINIHGSLKLSIIMTWNPLDGMDESVIFFQPPLRPTGLGVQKRPMSMITTSGNLSSSSFDLRTKPDRRFQSPVQALKQRDDSGIYGSASSLPSHLASDSRHNSPALSASPIIHACGPSWKPDIYSSFLRPYSFSTIDMRNIGLPQPQSASPTSECSDSSSPYRTYMLSQSKDVVASSSSSSSPILASASSTPNIHEVTQSMVPGVVVQQMVPLDNSITVGEALGNLMTTLEDFLGHYPELQRLEEVVQIIEALVRKTSITYSRSSSMNASIEGAIEEAFDFLNTEELLEDIEEQNESEAEEGNNLQAEISDIDKIIVSPSSTAKTADSGIESLAKRLQEDIHLGSSVGSSPVPPSSGSDYVDQALVFHLTHCDKLLETMGNFGPLKCREFYALDHLQKQAEILEKLVDIAKAGNDIDLHAVLSKETLDKTLRELWVLSVDQTPLYTQPEKIISVLEQKFGARLSEKNAIKPIRIFHQVMARLLYVAKYVPEIGHASIVTLHQFMLFFRDGDGLTKMEGIAEELRLMDLFNASASDTVIKAIINLQEELPPALCLKMLTKLLVGNSREVQQSATTYLKVISKNKTHRDKALIVLVEGLEDHIMEVRAGCCVALSIFEAEECIDQLVHLSQSDSSSTVRRKAKEALYSLGDIGRKALEEAQLSSQGFQGLQVHKSSVKRNL